MLLYRTLYASLTGALALVIYKGSGLIWILYPFIGVWILYVPQPHRRLLRRNNRAWGLLIRSLSVKQRLCLLLLGRFWVITPRGHHYTIVNPPIPLKVYRNVLGSEARYGAYLPHLPHYDTLLAQKLILETSPRRLLATACCASRIWI